MAIAEKLVGHLTTPERTSSLASRLAWWSPLLVLGAAMALRVVHPPAYFAFVEEDAPAEWLTFAVYAVAAVVAFRIATRLRHRGEHLFALAYLVLTLGFVAVAGEEITWGQRIFGFAGPEGLVEQNRQNEANVHNLLRPSLLHGAYVVVGLYGAGVGRWLLRRVPSLRTRWWLFAPGPSLTMFFLSVAGLYLYYEVVNDVVVAVLGEEWSWRSLHLARLQEVAELCLGAGFLGFVLGVRRRLTKVAPAR